MKLYTILLLLTTTLLTHAQTVIEPTLIWDPFGDVGYGGRRMKAGGDLNGDGYNEMILQYPGFIDDSTGVEIKDELRICLGGAAIDTDPDYIIPTIYDEDSVEFDFSTVAYNGDLNGDGYSDLVVGCSYQPNSYYYNEGAVLIYFGGEVLKKEPDFILKGRDYATDTWNLRFGSYIDLSGDFNGDGYNDLVISEKGPDYFFNGQVDIFYGGKEFDTVVDWHKKGENLQELGGDGFSIGDINADGFDDLVIFRHDGINPNGAYFTEIYAGGIEMDTTFAYITNSTYMCGDFDGDGYADCLNFDGILKGSNNFEMNFIEHNLTSDGATRAMAVNINSDKYSDVAIARSFDHRIDFYPGNSNLNFVSTYQFTTPEPNGMGNIFICLGNVFGETGHEYLVSCGYMGDVHLELYSFDSISSKITEFKKSKELQLLSYPNPFNSSTIISFNLQENIQNGELAVYNPSGQLVSTLYTGNLTKGKHSFNWQAHNQAAGVYLVKLKSGNKITTKKLLYVK